MTPGPDLASTPALHAVRTGSRGPAVVLIHGFTQTHVSWDPVAADLAADHRVLAVDAPGHGGSASIRTDLAGGARLLADLDLGRATGDPADAGAPADPPAVFVGYSMGGRLALRLALDRPDRVAGLVLLGATAGIDDPAERAERREADEALAARLEAEGVAPFLERWLAQPLFAGLTPAAADLAARRAASPTALATSLRLAGTGTMDPPWWEELPALAVPTLVLAGDRDEKFTALGHRLVEAIGPGARFEPIPAAGHAAHLERPDAVAALVRRFVADLQPR